ncbi:uncharacterized protein LOC144449093 isoform X3 [Glandiceps talaboti]
MSSEEVKTELRLIMPGKALKEKQKGSATYYDIDPNNKVKEKSSASKHKKKKMDGSDADGEWSEGDNEEEVIQQDERTSEYEEGTAEEEEEGEENGEETGEEVARKIDYADYIMDNIDSELHHIITRVVLERPPSAKQREMLAKQGVEFEYDSDNDEKTVSVRSSQRMTSDAGTADTGLGSGSLADDYGSSDFENGLSELSIQHDGSSTPTMTDIDAELVRQRLRQAVISQSRGQYGNEFEDQELDRQLDAKVEAAVEKLLSKLSDASSDPSKYSDSQGQGETTTAESTPRGHIFRPPSGLQLKSSSVSSGRQEPKPKKKILKKGLKKSDVMKVDKKSPLVNDLLEKSIPEVVENGEDNFDQRVARSRSPDGTMVAKGTIDPTQGFVPREIARVKYVSRQSDTDSIATEDFENLFRDTMVIDNVSNVSVKGKQRKGKPSMFLARRIGSDTESVVTVATDKFEDKFHDIMMKELERADKPQKKTASPGPSPVKATYIPSQNSPSKLTRSKTAPSTQVTTLKTPVKVASKDRSRSMSPPVRAKKYMVLSSSTPRSLSPAPLAVGGPMRKAKSYDDMDSIQTEDYISRYIGSMVHQKIVFKLNQLCEDPIPPHLKRYKQRSGVSDAESVTTEDFENQFHDMMIKQVAGVPIMSFEDVTIASDLDSVKTGEITKALNDTADGSVYQSESDLDSDKMEEIERKFQEIMRKKKPDRDHCPHSVSDVNSLTLGELTSQASTPRKPETSKIRNGFLAVVKKPAASDVLSPSSLPKAKSSPKTPTKKNPRKSIPSKKLGVSRSAERISAPRTLNSGSPYSQSNGGSRHLYDDDDMDENLLEKVEALINKQKGRLTYSPRTLSASMPNVSGRLTATEDLHTDGPATLSVSHSNLMTSEMRDVESGVREVKAKKQIALKELRVVQEALKRNKSDVEFAERSTRDYYHKTEALKSEVMMLELQRDQAQRELKDVQEDIDTKKRTMQQIQRTPPKTDTEGETGMTAAEILTIVKERDDLRTRVRNGEAEMSQLERLELERQLNSTKEELFIEKKSARTQVETLQEEVEDTKHRLEDSENARLNLAERCGTLEAKLQALENDTKKQIGEKTEAFDGLKDKLAKEMATMKQEMEHRNRRVLALESDIAEKEMANRQLQEKLIENQAEVRDEVQNRERTVEEKERLLKAAQAEKEMALNNLRDELRRGKDRDLMELQNKMEKERRDEVANQEDRIAEQMAEFQQVLLTKEEEVQMIRDRLRQQEEATRNLGERMREEAKEQIKSAISTEREIWEKEMERHISREQEAWEEESAKNIGKLKEEVDQEKQMILQLQNTIATLREEMEAHRQENRALHREKIDAVTKAREAARKEKQTELDKLREKLTQEKFKDVDKLRQKLRDQDDELMQLRTDTRCHSQKEKEISLQVERHERSLISEINDECKKTASAIGTSPRKVIATSSKADRSPSVNGSPTRSPKPVRSGLRPQVGEALGNLKSVNEELRQHLQRMKGDLEKEKKNTSKSRKEKEADLKRQRVQLERSKAAQMEALRDRLVTEHLEELNKLQKAVSKDDSTLHRELRNKDEELKEITKNMNVWKEETAQKMARKFEEELNREIDRRMKDQSRKLEITYKSQLSDQQRQMERLERELRRVAADKSSSLDTSQNSDTSTIRLLRHLQERVKHLREENMALRRQGSGVSGQSDTGTLEERTPVTSSGLEYSEDGRSSSHAPKLESRVRKLERQLRDAELQSRENGSLLSTKMTEIAKLQNALTHQTKELMKLERAYAKVQSELATSSMR